MGCLWTCLLRWEFAPSFLTGMSEMGLSVVTFCNLTAVIKNGPFYLDIFFFVAFSSSVVGSQSTAVLAAIRRRWIGACSISRLHPTTTSF